ncbi:hypothetical protein EVAR_15792_1 [Eumeta japonica]|uniref:Uncharacterized protein n=1 Tax=Eumeta variegata TaxID=151549 RepID=A0A4C1U064_EUMVA|nr:hypothetical protein EVAR_15792_1 [Eumeta japonica]
MGMGNWAMAPFLSNHLSFTAGEVPYRALRGWELHEKSVRPTLLRQRDERKREDKRVLGAKEICSSRFVYYFIAC